MRITVVDSTDLPELLSLVRAYCDFYQVTPSDRELLELHSAGLTVLSGCPSSEFHRRIQEGDRDGAVEVVK